MRTKQAIRTAGAMLILTWSAAAQQQTIKIWPGVAPGSENWSEPETVMKGGDTDRVANVVTPTLIAYLPEKSKATGTGIIIAPGGGFSYLAIDKEGNRVASWLQERGIAGFVLKYRVRQMAAADIAAFQARRASGNVGGRGTPAPGGRAGAPANAGALAAAAGRAGGGMDSVGQYGIADGIQALKVLRQRAGEFGLSPDRIGIVGFSAGAMVTSGVLLQEDPALRPAFAAPIYGGPFGAVPAIPQKLPPIFLAWAQDDTTAGVACARFYAALTAAGSNPEVHIYRAGGHGFGMAKQGTTSDHWIDEFYYWLEVQGLTKPAAR
ncbi:MAG: carboxylesterase family protein [Candidatus Solibacter sp.]|nr:carboxylesterase family protein [Candidatus Solibacter sp.]